MTKKRKKIVILTILILLLIAIMSGVVFDLYFNKDLSLYNIENRSTYKVMQSGKVLGTVKRNLPEVSNEGLEKYPTYGTTLALTDEEKQAILDENTYINASNTTYNSMDSEGNLYLDGTSIGRKLYKHTASISMYYGDVSDEEKAVIKKLTYNARPSGNHITGLYAPAGEVVKIEISQKDLEKTNGLTIYIGQTLANGQANNIWLARDFNRMPVILNTMSVAKTTSYVGSYLGGPIFIKPNTPNTKFSVTVSGAVEYSHFILGQTTKEEFERTKNSSAPYFDLEVWDRGVRHSGPKKYAQMYGYDDLYKIGVLWDKISSVSTQVPAGSRTDIGIDFLYDPFVAAGAMVAFVGRNTVNCPANTLQNALNYEICINNGFWGVIHEYNHHFQRFGFAPGDEVTNNAINLVEYSLFTKISSYRTTSDTTNNGLGDWNRYTNADWVLKQTKATITNAFTNTALDSYANILHSFGQDIFIKATKNGGGSGGVDAWYKAVCDATGYDMKYYFESMLNVTISETVLQEYGAKNYPMYVPISSIYQTGLKYNDYKFKTMQPYLIDKSIKFDLNSCITLPEGFSYKINSVSNAAQGKLTKTAANIYTYNLQNNTNSGEIIINISIAKDDNAFNVNDVNLIFEFEQNKKQNILQRKIYVYDDYTMYKTLSDAIDNNFIGYSQIIEEDNINPTQNSNSEIWVPNPSKNAIMEISGKIEITDTAKYRLAVRGRYNIYLYTSLDNKNYKLAVDYVNTTTSPTFDLTDTTKYIDYNLNKGDYLYFKAYLLVSQSNCFIGLGFGKFNNDDVTVSYLNALRTDYIKEEFNPDYFYTKTVTYDIQEDISVKQTLISSVYHQWGDIHPIEYLFDEDETNFIHSDKQDISQDNPFEIVVDLNKKITANTFTIIGEPTRVYLPTTYQLYLGYNLDNLSLVADVTGATVSNNKVSYTFPIQSFRYYKLVVTDTSATAQQYRCIAFRGIKFSVIALNGVQISPDDTRLTYFGKWEQTSTFATFGHINSTSNGIIEFEFKGTQLALLSYCSKNYGTFKIYIDDKLQASPSLKSSQNEIQRVFLSNQLADKTHKVRIVAKEKFNIDSIIIW